MEKKLTFAVIGGDMRQVKLAESFAVDGHSVSIFALDNLSSEPRVRPTETLKEAVSSADCVVLPLPVLNEEGCLNTPLVKSVFKIEEMFSAFQVRQTICAGRVSGDLFEMAGRRGIRLYDYFAREELAVANAVPTAARAIQIAMEELPITLHESNCLVIGYGRIGRLLAYKLKMRGANITVSARNFSDMAWIEAFGYAHKHTEKLNGELGGFDVIFNTVPSRVLGEELLSQLDTGCICIDLASKPGGLDFSAASKLGVKAIWALALPGKVAPVTSGKIIKNTIYNILYELGV